MHTYTPPTPLDMQCLISKLKGGNVYILYICTCSYVMYSSSAQSGFSALLWASIKGYTDIADKLLKNEADPNLAAPVCHGNHVYSVLVWFTISQLVYRIMSAVELKNRLNAGLWHACNKVPLGSRICTCTM